MFFVHRVKHRDEGYVYVRWWIAVACEKSMTMEDWEVVSRGVQRVLGLCLMEFEVVKREDEVRVLKVIDRLPPPGGESEVRGSVGVLWDMLYAVDAV